MWAALKEYFQGPDLENHKEDVFLHMRSRWWKWRSRLYGNRVKTSKSLAEALTKVPDMMSKEDWEWCVKEALLSGKYQKRSKTNEINRSKKVMHHHSGSTSIGQITYHLAKRIGREPNRQEVWYETYKSGDSIKDPKASEAHEQIGKIIEANPDMDGIEVMEKQFGEQKHGSVISYGGGVRPKDLKGPQRQKIAALEERLRISEENNAANQQRLADERAEMREQVRAEVQAEMRAKMRAEVRKEMESYAQMFQAQNINHNEQS